MLEWIRRRKALRKATAAIGVTLHRQFMEARNAPTTTEEESIRRMDDGFVAGYVLGYIEPFMDELNATAKERAWCARLILNGIFPGRGAAYLQTRVEQRDLARDASFPEARKYAADFDSGMEAGEHDAINVQAELIAEPTSLKDYLTVP